jgi:hypothetical protein
MSIEEKLSSALRDLSGVCASWRAAGIDHVGIPKSATDATARATVRRTCHRGLGHGVNSSPVRPCMRALGQLIERRRSWEKRQDV